MQHSAEIGIFGGSGFYEFAEGEVEEVTLETPYGPPSGKVALMTVAGRRVAFLARHGVGHSIPAHRVPYKANLWAFQELGVRRVLAPSAVGSLQAHVVPGHFVINDQFVDRTRHRDDTYYNGPVTTHISSAEPYCPQLRSLAIEATKTNDVTVHETGTVVVIEGPRFSSKAESRWFTSLGWEIISMTQYPESILARELAMCYVNISLVTDYDAGLVAGEGHVEAHDVMAVLQQNTANVKRVLRTMLAEMPGERSCSCADALKFARLE